MERQKQILHRLLYPNILLLIFLSLVSSVLLAVVFIWKPVNPAAAYTIYMVSAYTTAAIVLRMIVLVKKGRALLHRSVFFHRYLTELDFKAEVSLYGSFAVSMIYSIYKAAVGICLHSVWFGMTALYYMLLSTEKVLLLRRVRKKKQDPSLNFQKFRFSGYLLPILTATVICIGLYTVYFGKAARYPGSIIYAAAGYTFYSLILAIVNIVRYRKLNNPVYSASKAVTLTAALVSVFSLQTAMLETFGGDAPWQKQMNLWTGSGIILLVTAMTFFLRMRYTVHNQKGAAAR
ncbi:hypothetical protein [Qiania dongpingensis]|uniref:Uncharacterized protein n=1 Tax=Qiania dongpingensis TaxID=2763669 RepID=A0A7G9G314_9FIRM|nr:hypothetical protein [Qiania dongpingensis]QNM05196.1 hypothetical protein H9Q78_12220 [Qiania dongpingensis]